MGRNAADRLITRATTMMMRLQLLKDDSGGEELVKYFQAHAFIIMGVVAALKLHTSKKTYVSY